MWAGGNRSLTVADEMSQKPVRADQGIGRGAVRRSRTEPLCRGGTHPLFSPVGAALLQITLIIIYPISLEKRFVLIHKRSHFMVLLLIAYVLNHLGQN